MRRNPAARPPRRPPTLPAARWGPAGVVAGQARQQLLEELQPLEAKVAS